MKMYSIIGNCKINQKKEIPKEMTSQMQMTLRGGLMQGWESEWVGVAGIPSIEKYNPIVSNPFN